MVLNVTRATAAAVLFLLLVPCGGLAQHATEEFPELSGPYLGQEAPGDSPVLFAPGIVSTNTRDWSMATTPDGLELFFGISSEEIAFIVHTREVDGRWTEPAVASFSGIYGDLDLTMSPGGNRLYFSSDRPAEGSGAAQEQLDIWYVDRTDDGWGAPVRFPDPINTQARELYPSESRDGYVYFFSSRPGGFGGSDLYRVSLREGVFGEPENLGPSINTEAGESDACVSPDGDFLVFTSSRDDGFGKGDLYVSFKTAEGGWTEAVNLGEKVNTEHTEFCPSITSDGRYLFFTSNRPKAEAITDIPGIRKELGVAPSSRRPDIDIYWMEAGFIDEYR